MVDPIKKEHTVRDYDDYEEHQFCGAWNSYANSLLTFLIEFADVYLRYI